MVFLPDVQYCALFLNMWGKGISWNAQGSSQEVNRERVCVLIHVDICIFIYIYIHTLSINTTAHYSHSRFKVDLKLQTKKYPKIKSYLLN